MACTRCRRPVLVPVMVDGKGYGRSCAAKVGDLLVQPQHRDQPARRRRGRTNENQGGLFA